jgi:hypothetical protein
VDEGVSKGKDESAAAVTAVTAAAETATTTKAKAKTSTCQKEAGLKGSGGRSNWETGAFASAGKCVLWAKPHGRGLLEDAAKAKTSYEVCKHVHQQASETAKQANLRAEGARAQAGKLFQEAEELSEANKQMEVLKCNAETEGGAVAASVADDAAAAVIKAAASASALAAEEAKGVVVEAMTMAVDMASCASALEAKAKAAEEFMKGKEGTPWCDTLTLSGRRSGFSRRAADVKRVSALSSSSFSSASHQTTTRNLRLHTLTATSADLVELFGHRQRSFQNFLQHLTNVSPEVCNELSFSISD